MPHQLLFLPDDASFPQDGCWSRPDSDPAGIASEIGRKRVSSSSQDFHVPRGLLVRISTGRFNTITADSHPAQGPLGLE